MVAFVGLALLVSAGLLAVTGISARRLLREQLRRRLMGVAAAGSLLINPGFIAKINSPADERKAPYLKTRIQLQAIRDSNPGLRYVYLMRPNLQSAQWRFVVDAEEDPALVSHPGEDYDVSNAPEIWSALRGPAADQELNWDKWGCWLSGYAPVKDYRGHTVAILGLDMSAAEVTRQEHAGFAAVLFGVGVILLISILLADRLSVRLCRPLRVLAKATQAVADGNLDTEVTVCGSKEMLQLGESFNIMVSALREDNRRMLELNSTDFLTSLRNHRYFQERLEQEVNRAARHDHFLALLKIDLDLFRRVNDEYGHQSGDQLLYQTAELIRENLRDYDIPTRYGGDEFAVIMPETTKDEAGEVAERIRQAIEGHPFVINVEEEEITLRVTASLGIAEFPTDSTEREGLIVASDLAILQAKHISRNRVCRFWRVTGQGASSLNLSQLHRALENGNLAAVESLAEALDARDSYTRGHSENVTRLAVTTCRAMGLPPEAEEHLRLAGLLHDIGKIGIPDNILRKGGTLTPRERELVRAHPALAASILEKVPLLADIIPTILSHHEHWDGTGYPNGLVGEEIPLPARILSVADVFDAMTSDRPYRPAMPREKALAELRFHAGSFFDPAVVAAFVDLVLRYDEGEANVAVTSDLA